MANKTRVPLQVSVKFADRLKELQRKIRMQTGTDKSLRDLTDEIVSLDLFSDVENKILKQGNGSGNIEFKVKLDRRFFQ